MLCYHIAHSSVTVPQQVLPVMSAHCSDGIWGGERAYRSQHNPRTPALSEIGPATVQYHPTICA